MDFLFDIETIKRKKAWTKADKHRHDKLTVWISERENKRKNISKYCLRNWDEITRSLKLDLRDLKDKYRIISIEEEF